MRIPVIVSPREAAASTMASWRDQSQVVGVGWASPHSTPKRTSVAPVSRRASKVRSICDRDMWIHDQGALNPVRTHREPAGSLTASLIWPGTLSGRDGVATGPPRDDWASETGARDKDTAAASDAAMRHRVRRGEPNMMRGPFSCGRAGGRARDEGKSPVRDQPSLPLMIQLTQVCGMVSSRLFRPPVGSGPIRACSGARWGSHRVPVKPDPESCGGTTLAPMRSDHVTETTVDGGRV